MECFKYVQNLNNNFRNGSKSRTQNLLFAECHKLTKGIFKTQREEITNFSKSLNIPIVRLQLVTLSWLQFKVKSWQIRDFFLGVCTRQYNKDPRNFTYNVFQMLFLSWNLENCNFVTFKLVIRLRFWEIEGNNSLALLRIFV